MVLFQSIHSMPRLLRCCVLCRDFAGLASAESGNPPDSMNVAVDLRRFRRPRVG
jgi:hypothetical protein